MANRQGDVDLPKSPPVNTLAWLGLAESRRKKQAGEKRYYSTVVNTVASVKSE
jgi:hypothetical protein